MALLARWRVDPFLLLLVATLGLASLLPARGGAAIAFDRATDWGIAALFFLHGARLSRAAVLAGLGNWRLHLLVLATTYAVFPLVGLGAVAALGPALDPLVATGLLYLCVLPSTVQSSIAFTSIAGGNVPAAVCSASLSNVLGIVLTPLLASLLIGGGQADGGFFADAVTTIASTLLLPFVAGHLARPLIGPLVDRNRTLLGRVDRGVILLVVYTAFSASVVEGLWTRLSALDLGSLLLFSGGLLGTILLFTGLMARTARLSRADEIVLVFCGSKKSLASGVPMAGALFPPAQIGLLILPLMLFHQLQLIVCAALAQRYVRRAERPAALAGVVAPGT